MTDIELLPLPDDAAKWLRQYGVANTAFQMEAVEGWFQAHARAVAEHNVKKRDAEIETLRAALESLKAHRENAAMNQAGIIKALEEVRDEQGAEIHRLRAERNAQQRKAERLEEAKAKVSELRAELDRLRGELRGEHVRVLRDRNAKAARAERMEEALRMIAAPMRSDGSWNRDREACRQIAYDALIDHDQEVSNG